MVSSCLCFFLRHCKNITSIDNIISFGTDVFVLAKMVPPTIFPPSSYIDRKIKDCLKHLLVGNFIYVFLFTPIWETLTS